MYIEIYKRMGWRWRLVGKNGEILAHSEAYFSKWNAKRAAKKMATASNLEVRYESA